LLDRKLDAKKPSPPKVEASVNPKVEQLAHVLEITLIVVPDNADLLNFNFRFLIIYRLKFTKIATRTELIQVKINASIISLGHRMSKRVKKRGYYQMCLLLSKK
jgi:hypothetical protein